MLSFLRFILCFPQNTLFRSFYCTKWTNLYVSQPTFIFKQNYRFKLSALANFFINNFFSTHAHFLFFFKLNFRWTLLCFTHTEMFVCCLPTTHIFLLSNYRSFRFEIFYYFIYFRVHAAVDLLIIRLFFVSSFVRLSVFTDH